MNTCSSCRHWQGDEGSYMAACNHPDSGAARVAFDATCAGYEARAPLALAVIDYHERLQQQLDRAQAALRRLGVFFGRETYFGRCACGGEQLEVEYHTRPQTLTFEGDGTRHTLYQEAIIERTYTCRSCGHSWIE